mmetsp:Transcript_16273/g.20129  ORF Transcript_16273/g.20129 Transcript_16273/m.20129 type:complete len:281 (-) Transcript_16273:91-933(-)
MTHSNRKKAGYDHVHHILHANSGFPFLMFLAAVIAVVSAGVECFENGGQCDGVAEEITFYLGCVLLVCVTVYLWLILFKKPQPLCVVLLSVIFFLLWTAYAGYTTFETQAPFAVVGNGYFAVWLGFIASTGMMVNNIHTLHTMSDEWSHIQLHVPLSLLIVCSLLVVIASLIEHSRQKSTVAILGATIGGLSLLLTIGRIFTIRYSKSANEKLARYFGYLMITLWLVGSLALTFSIFKVTGNGFFGAWGSFIVSIWITRVITSKEHTPAVDIGSATFDNV